MKKTILMMLSFLLSFAVFSQETTINGCHGDAESDCLLSVCEGSSSDSLFAGFTGSGTAVGYTWRLSEYDPATGWSGYHTVSNNQNIVMPSIYGHQYKYQLTIDFGGSYSASYALLSVNSTPNAVLSSDTNVICFGEVVNFTATTSGSSYDFLINNISIQNGNLDVFSTNALNDGEVAAVVVTNASGCSDTSNYVVMTVHSLPDATNIIASNACDDGSGMDFEYVDLTGSGDWTVQFWNTAHTIQYGTDYSTTTANGLFLGVDIPYGTSNVDVKIIDNGTHCPNF